MSVSVSVSVSLSVSLSDTLESAVTSYVQREGIECVKNVNAYVGVHA